MRRAALPLLLVAASAAAGTNIHPDPSFERTGAPGVARTGKRAGHLKVGGYVYWTAIGGKLAVEPFATYRATGYVRAKPGKGTLYGLYMYSWNSFDWRWSRSVPLTKPIAEWKKIEITFVVPNDYIHFHPLAAIRGEGCEAWIDDVAVEKIREPEDTMKAVLAKPPAGDQDIELRVRWFVARGEVDKARALAARASSYVKADIAGLLAQQAKNPAEKLQLVAEMVGYGGLGYGDGARRFRELTADLSPPARQAIYLRALQASGFAAPAARAYAAMLATRIDEAAHKGTIARSDRQLDSIATQLDALLGRCPGNAPGRKELAQVKQKLAAARAAVAERRAQLGQCTITIGGKAVTGKTHAIVVPDEPTPQEDFAAADLQGHIEKLTGQALPIVADADLTDQTPITVGRCTAALKKLGVAIDFKSLGLEGIVIETKGPALILAGNRRGVLYAVYSFLEDHCGCRWFTPDCTVIPRTGAFAIGKLNIRYAPPLEYRSTDYPCSRDGNWAVRNKINGTQARLDEPRGGKIAYSHFVHTFNSILSPAQHFGEHPEWFSMVNGKRIGGRTQLCLTNPEVLAIAKRTVRRWIQQAPDATIFSVSQNDWRNPCTCPACKALDEKEGTHAGSLIHFVNAIARDIAADHPDKLISTLAYQYTRTPPKHVRPEPNVTVRLCTIECDFARPLDVSTHPQNVKFVADIKGWNTKCKRLYIWDYIIDYGHSVMPWPNLYALQGNIRFFIANGVKGLYEEACYFTKGSELAELRTWIIAKHMWNPDYGTDRAIDEFLAGYYGPAAKPIRAYINLMHKPVRENPKLYIHIWTPPTAPYLTEQAIAESVRLFDQAEAAVKDDPVLLHRVQVARLPIMYVQIARAKQGYREQPDALVSTTGTDIRAVVKRFETIARKEGLTTIRENRRTGALDVWLKSLNATGRKLPLVRLESPTLALAILPAVGGRIWKMVHKPTGREILKRYQDRDGAEIPDKSGYEEYTEGEYHSPGWNEAYRVVKKSKTSVTLEAKLANGLRVTRIITLDPKLAKVTINTTATNVGKAPVKAQLRSHPGFAVSDVQKCSIVLARPGGRTETRSLAFAKDPQQEKDQWLGGAAAPAGEWTLVDGGTKLQIRNRFDPKQIMQCLLNRSGADRRVNLELYAEPLTLAPGKSQRLTHSIEVEAARSTKQ